MKYEFFLTEKSQGAFLNGHRIQVSEQKQVKHSCLVTGFPYTYLDVPNGPLDVFSRLIREGIPVRRLGSAAIDLCWVAAGRFDGFYEQGLKFTAEDVINMTIETRKLLPLTPLSVTIPHTLALHEQVLIETEPLIITQLNMFQYSNYDNVTHCYTDASQFKIPFQRVMIGNITLLSYLQQHYPGSTISPEQIIITFKEALLQEDKFNGTGPLFIDRVDKTLYSIPGKTGFKYGPSICSQLYDAMVKYYPERVITCPTRQTILQSGDSFSFVGIFVGTKEITINFNIQIQ